MDILEEVVMRRKTLKAIITKRRYLEEEVQELMEEQPLSPAARLFHQPRFSCYILAIMGCNNKIDLTLAKTGLKNTLVKHHRFSSLLVMNQRKNQMAWVPTQVKIERHIIMPDLDPNMECPDKFVEEYIAKLTNTSMDMSKPLWDVHLLNVKVRNAEAVGIFRFHHSLGDGASLMSLLLACTRKTSNPDALPSVPIKKNKEPHEVSCEPRTRRFMLLWKMFKALWVFFQIMWNTLVDIFTFICTMIFLKDTQTPLRCPPGVECRLNRIVYRTVSLDDIKLVKNHMNMTINDVVLGVTAAGLSRYLNRRYCEGKKFRRTTKKKNYLPKNIRLRASLLVNIRPAVGIQAMADMMEKDRTYTKWGNWLGIVLLPFSIGIRDDPLDYVREAKTIIDRKKLSLEAVFTFAGVSLIVKFLGIMAASALASKVLTHTTMTFSNVVGPLEEIGCYGHSLAYLAPSVYGHPQGLSIHFQSYIDKMTIVLAVDEKCVPDPHKLCDDLEISLEMMKNAITAGS